MRRLTSTFGILAVALAAATPVLAAPNAGNIDPAGIAHADRSPDGHRARGMDGTGRNLDRTAGRPGHPPVPMGLEIAARLSALEVYVGITSDQEDAWRRYTSSLIAMFDRPMPEGGQPSGDSAQGGQQNDDAPEAPPLLSERLAADAIARGEAASALQEAIDDLRTTLDPAQFARLAAVERSIAGMPGPGGPAHPPMMGPGADRIDNPGNDPRPTPPSPMDR